MTRRPGARTLRGGLAALVILGATLRGEPASAQNALAFDDPPRAGSPLFRVPPVDAPLYVVIHIADNRLYLIEDQQVRWSVPVATGTGFRLEESGRAWQFDTPRGLFFVQHKETDPIWFKPDWHFIENGQPVPPRSSPLRDGIGMLGTTAIYIGYELALHGTDKPELVLDENPEARRVSHGCIRLTNEDARVLYHLVDIGTPVVIY